MNSRPTLVTVGFLLGLVSAATALGKPLADLVSPEKRRSIVEQALRLTRPPEPVPLPADLAQPFNPPGFDQPDPEELRAAAAASAKVIAAGGVAGGGGIGGAGAAGGAGGAAGAAGGPAALMGDRELLESIAAKILPTGMIKVGGEPLLIFGRRNVKIGGSFTVTNPANGQDYTLELIAIEPPTFTLRYRNEEITRPIKSGKSQ
jgi:hypothetical protein